MYDDPGWERITVGRIKVGDRLARDGSVVAEVVKLWPLPWRRLRFTDGFEDVLPNNQLLRVYRQPDRQMKIGDTHEE